MNAIELKDISVEYAVKFIEEKKVRWEKFWALSDINISVAWGEVLGVIGENGAGKTTILKLIAGRLIPDKGEIYTQGKISTLMELGAGFNPEFTGRENITLNARAYGLDDAVLEEKFDEIANFAGLGRFIDAPIKYYSQGMYMRLSFALAIFIGPDILLIDEVLAVGDQEAQQRCINQIIKLKNSGKTIILVSHDLDMVRKLCNRIILLEKGKVIREGGPEQVISYYREIVGDKKGIGVLKRNNPEEMKRKISLQTISCGKAKVFLDLEDKKIRVYYNEQELTMLAGLHFTLTSVNHGTFVLSDAKWDIQKISEEEIRLVLTYEKVPVVMRWCFHWQDDYSFGVNIDLEVKQNIFLVDAGVKLELIDGYERWETSEEEGSFFVRRYINDVGPIRLKNNRVSGVVLSSRQKEVPCITFIPYQEENRIINLYKRKDKDGECVGIYSARIAGKREKEVCPGKHTYYEGKVIFNKPPVWTELIRDFTGSELSNNDFKFIFDRGRGKIFWKQKELTAGLGVYTSLRSNGIWYDSYQGIWRIAQNIDNTIVVLGSWPHIPVSQIWKISLVGKNMIFWQVDMEIYEDMDNLEIEQANIMLSSEYKNWIIPKFIQGEFLNEYTDSYDIIPFRFWYGKAGEITVVSDDMPEVSFRSNMDNAIFRAVVENTDDLYRGRLLQYQKANSDTIKAGKYTYFKGGIEVGFKE